MTNSQAVKVRGGLGCFYRKDLRGSANFFGTVKFNNSADSYLKEYCAKFEKIDVLFNVAGWVPHGSIMDSTEDVWNKARPLSYLLRQILPY